MRIAPDTNVLVRAIVDDDPRQADLARRALAEADTVAVSTTALCELVWVLSSAYRRSRQEIALAVRTLAQAGNVEIDDAVVAAGLAMLDAGGDFADGVIAHEGRRQGAETFVSFDRDAVRRLTDLGEAANLLG